MSLESQAGTTLALGETGVRIIHDRCCSAPHSFPLLFSLRAPPPHAQFLLPIQDATVLPRPPSQSPCLLPFSSRPPILLSRWFVFFFPCFSLFLLAQFLPSAQAAMALFLFPALSLSPTLNSLLPLQASASLAGLRHGVGACASSKGLWPSETLHHCCHPA